ERLDLRQARERPPDVHQLLFRGYDFALVEESLHGRIGNQALDEPYRRLQRSDDAAAQEDGVDDFRVAVCLGNTAGMTEVLVGDVLDRPGREHQVNHLVDRRCTVDRHRLRAPDQSAQAPMSAEYRQTGKLPRRLARRLRLSGTRKAVAEGARGRTQEGKVAAAGDEPVSPPRVTLAEFR